MSAVAKRHLLRPLAPWALLALAACSSANPKVSLAAPGSIGAGDYELMLERWTRADRIIKKLDTTLRVYATLFSPEFEAAYIAKRTQLFSLPPHDRARLRAEFERMWAESYVFIVATATVDFGWNDFASKRSVWRVSLASDRGQQVAASSIRQERIDASLVELFPYIGRFYRAYTFRFPKTLENGEPLLPHGARSLQLLFSGALGQTRLVWRLR